MNQGQTQFLEDVRSRLLIVFGLFLFAQCSSTIAPKANSAGSTVKDVSDKLLPAPSEIHYDLLATKEQKDWLLALEPGDTLNAILILNRIDKRRLLAFDTLVVPRIFGPIAIYTPFPKQLTNLKEVKKIILISYYTQAFAVYEQGELIRWGPTSMGKKKLQLQQVYLPPIGKQKKRFQLSIPIGKWNGTLIWRISKVFPCINTAYPAILLHMPVFAYTRRMLFGYTSGQINGF